MHEVIRCAAQGDLFLRRIDRLPTGVVEQAQSGRYIVLAHSETGHDHVVDATGCKLFAGSDPMVCYLVAESVEFADLIHKREWDTHQTLRLLGKGAVWEVRRQREHTPAGWRRVED